MDGYSRSQKGIDKSREVPKETMEQISQLNLIGCRIKVKWTNPQGWWKGTIVDYEPVFNLSNHRLFVKELI